MYRSANDTGFVMMYNRESLKLCEMRHCLVLAERIAQSDGGHVTLQCLIRCETYHVGLIEFQHTMRLFIVADRS